MFDYPWWDLWSFPIDVCFLFGICHWLIAFYLSTYHVSILNIFEYLSSYPYKNLIELSNLL